MHEAVRLRSLKVGATRHGRLDVVAERIQDPGCRKLLSVVTDKCPDVWFVSSLVAGEGGAASERLAAVGMLTYIRSLSSMGSSVASQ